MLQKIVPERNISGLADNYYTTVLESNIFSKEVFDRILATQSFPETENDGEITAINSLLKRLILDICVRMMQCEPPIINKLIDSGKMLMLVESIT